MPVVEDWTGRGCALPSANFATMPHFGAGTTTLCSLQAGERHVVTSKKRPQVSKAASGEQGPAEERATHMDSRPVAVRTASPDSSEAARSTTAVMAQSWSPSPQPALAHLRPLC